MQPVFLILNEVLKIHEDQIARYGGSAGIRDLNLLKSAVGMPASTFGEEFLHSDLFEMAAAYLFHIVKNHPFIDGNKRVGAVAAIVFLNLNGFELNAAPSKLANFVFGIARGDLDKADAVEFFKRWAGRA